jgi:hypothetical protein
MVNLNIKLQTLSRSVASVPNELKTWLEWATTDHALEKNFTQIRRLVYFVEKLCQQNNDSLGSLEVTDTDTFLDQALELISNVIKTHTVWDFFRDRLELRFVPQFQEPLLLADLVAHDCYSTVMERAEALRIIPQHDFREYPLIGLVAEFSPATLRRGHYLKALENENLPIPVINLPWDYLSIPWLLLTIAHEAGHDLDEDLNKLSEVLKPHIGACLKDLNVPQNRIENWQRWTSEILADLMGILLTGPAFTSVLTEMLTLPRIYVLDKNPGGKHPPHYLRIFINTTLIQSLGLSQYANTFETNWQMLYDKPNSDFTPYLADIQPVLSTMLDTPLMALQDRNGGLHSLKELVPFTPDTQVHIQDAAAELDVGPLTSEIPIRHVVSAVRLAFEKAVTKGHTCSVETLIQHAQKSISELAPPGQLDKNLSRRASEHLDKLAHDILKYPLSEFGIDSAIVNE